MAYALREISKKEPNLRGQSEIELIIHCLRTDDADNNDIARLIKNGIDWQYFLELTVNHNIVPLIYRYLKRCDSELIPHYVIDTLNKQNHHNMQKSLVYTTELIKIAKLFQQNNINLLAFKGAILSVLIFKDPAIRQFSDLDIYIEESKVPQALELLKSIGYEFFKGFTHTEDRPYLYHSLFHESYQYQGAYDLANYQTLVSVELHWALTKKSFTFPANFAYFWQSRNQIKLAGVEIATFGVEDLLVYLCMHSSKHCWSKFKWISDVAELIKSSPEIDWTKTIEIARNLSSSRMLSLGLLLVKKIYAINFPQNVEEYIKQDRIAIELANKIEDNLYLDQGNEEQNYLYTLKIIKQPLYKLNYIIKLSLTPTKEDWLFLPLPKFLFFGYYLVRPWRLLITKINSFFKT